MRQFRRVARRAFSNFNRVPVDVKSFFRVNETLQLRYEAAKEAGERLVVCLVSAQPKLRATSISRICVAGGWERCRKARYDMANGKNGILDPPIALC